MNKKQRQTNFKTGVQNVMQDWRGGIVSRIKFAHGKKRQQLRKASRVATAMLTNLELRLRQFELAA